MTTTTINDNTIWAKNIEGGRDLRDRIMKMRPGEVLDLEVDGIVGKWERMRHGKDGRPTFGIKPVAEMRRVWALLQKQRGRIVTVREVVAADSYLAAIAPLFSEWDSPEDDEAYRDL